MVKESLNKNVPKNNLTKDQESISKDQIKCIIFDLINMVQDNKKQGGSWQSIVAKIKLI